MKEPNRVIKNEVKYNVQLNEEQKEAKRLILENQIVIITGRQKFRLSPWKFRR